MASETIRFMILLFCKILEANCSDRAYLNKMVQNLNFLNFVPSMQPDLALNLKSNTECVTKCLQIQTCHIVFYKNDFHLCNLYITTTYKTIFQNLIQDSGWKSYYHDQRACDTNGYTFSASLSRCINAVNGMQNYSQAKDTCQLEGGYLVKVDGLSMWHFVKSLLESLGIIDAYIQGRRDLGGVWRYDDGTVMSFLKWGLNQPTGGPNRHVDLWKNDFYRFHDVQGHMFYGYVCEIF